jgi:hypothetical protein
MNAVLRGRVTAGRACNTCSLPTLRVHQTECQENEPEGRTLAETFDCMLDFLAQAIEFAGVDRRRHSPRLALIDLRVFDPRCMNRA